LGGRSVEGVGSTKKEKVTDANESAARFSIGKSCAGTESTIAVESS